MTAAEQRVALVTGAAQGIGYAIAERLLLDGHQVVLADFQETVQAAATRLGAAGAVQVDVRQAEAFKSAIDETAASHGRLDVLVNCAGTCGRLGFEEMTLEHWQQDIDTNLTAVMFGCQAAVFPHMREQGWGRLINIVSVSSKAGGVGPVYLDGRGGRSGAAYAAAKAGSLNLTRWIARQVGAWGITANAIAPGPIESAMTAGQTYSIDELPIPRFGKPAEVAGAVSYLAGPDADFVTGTCLHVDGGMIRA
ncbi:MAG: SDR family oxidoreductase [Frankiaceae bacterium]|nr:SDR family oxidoreductase [Frankiaceae bacterium]